jgi:hypothetical protein
MPSPKEIAFYQRYRAAVLAVGGLECPLCTWAGWALDKHAKSYHGHPWADFTARFPGLPAFVVPPVDAPPGIDHRGITPRLGPGALPC